MAFAFAFAFALFFRALVQPHRASDPGTHFILHGQRAHLLVGRLGFGKTPAQQVQPLLEPPGALARLQIAADQAPEIGQVRHQIGPADGGQVVVCFAVLLLVFSAAL